RDGQGAPRHRRGSAGSLAHGDRSRPHVRALLGTRRGLRWRRGGAALDLLLRVSAGRRHLRADRLRGRRAGRIRLGDGRVPGRDHHRRRRVARRRVRRARRQEHLRFRHLPRGDARPPARPVGEAMKIALGILVAAALLFPFVFRGPFPQHLAILVMLYALLGSAWNLLGGFAGQVSLGQAIFFGAGAYTSTLLAQHAGLSPWVGMIAGALVAGALALAIGYPCFRLSGHYFAIATIAIGEIAGIAVTNWDFGGGAVGLFLPVGTEGLLSFQFHRSKLGYYYVLAAMLLATLLLSAGWARSSAPCWAPWCWSRSRKRPGCFSEEAAGASTSWSTGSSSCSSRCSSPPGLPASRGASVSLLADRRSQRSDPDALPFEALPHGAGDDRRSRRVAVQAECLRPHRKARSGRSRHVAVARDVQRLLGRLVGIGEHRLLLLARHEPAVRQVAAVREGLVRGGQLESLRRCDQ